jgi:alpha-beta hydrolase superfamily lysophospholipase
VIARGVSLVRGAALAAGIVVALLTRVASSDSPGSSYERTVCGPLLERMAFAAWSAAAGEPDPDSWRTVAGASPIKHLTADGRSLHGFRISPKTGADATGIPTGFVLFMQGNAMLADQLLDTLRAFAERGLDAYVYDYRGYGRSQGRRRLAAIVADYREIFAALSASSGDGPKHLYGVSFGGLIALNVIGGGARFDRAVIDSTPSRVSPFGCPETFDPVRNLPDAASGLLVISGAKDNVVSPRAQAELRSAAQARGARVVLHEEFAHPFMDRDAAVRAEREALVHDFLAD